MDQMELESILGVTLTGGSEPDIYLPPDGWQFAESFPSLQNTLLGELAFLNPSFTIVADDPNGLDPEYQNQFGYPLSAQVDLQEAVSGLRFSGTIELEPMSALSTFFQSESFDFEGPLEILDDLPRLRLQATNAVRLGIEGFGLDIHLAFLAVWNDQSTDTERSLSSASFLNIDTEFELSADAILPVRALFFNVEPTLIDFIADTARLSTLGFTTLAALFEDVALVTPDLSFTEDLVITDLTLSLSVSDNNIAALGASLAYEGRWEVLQNPSLAFYGLAGSIDITDPFDSELLSYDISLNGNADIDGVTIESCFDPSTLDFDTGLVEGDRIDITWLVTPIVPKPIDLPTMDCTVLNVRGNLSSQAYEILATVETDWDILGDQSLFLENLTFWFQRTSGATPTTEGYIDGFVTLAGVPVSVRATYSSEPGTGWQFEGAIGDGQTIPMGELTADVADLFGSVDLPAAIADMEIVNLGVSFNTGTKDFSFNCGVFLPIDGQDVATTVTIKCVHAPGGYGVSAHITFADLVFDLVADGTSDTFLATLYEEGGISVNVKNLVAAVSDDVADHIPESLTLTLKDALFAYSKTDENSAKYLFGLDLATGLNLSDLPLVGQELPADQTLGVDDLQLLVASHDFLPDEAASLNSLLPDGVTALPNSGLSTGFNVSALMRLGDDVQRLEMPVPNTDDSGTSTTGPATSTPTTTDGTTTPAPTTASADATWYTLQKAFGPVAFERVGVRYKDDAVWFLLDAALTIAGLTISVAGLAMGSPLHEFDPRFNIDGVGLDYQNGPMEIGGAFLRVDTGNDDDYQFDGGVVLKSEGYSLSAMGSYAEVDGQPSLFVYALLDKPLGGPSFFFVTGLCAGFGYNRSVAMPAIDDVATFPLVAEAMSPTIDPNDLTAAMASLQPYMSPAVGEDFLMLGIKFNSFKLIDSFALFTFIGGDHPEVQVLGLSQLILPTPVPGTTDNVRTTDNVTPLAEVKLALQGSIDPDDGIMGIQGQLTSDSYLLSKDCHLTGGFAFYSWFAGDHEDDFVQTIGGYHPDFDVPAHYPTVPRLGFNWNLDSHTTIEGEAYCALTPHVLMAGGYLQATWQSGDLKAHFNAGADLLVAWQPYHYEADMHVSVGASYKIDVAGIKTKVSADLGCKLHLWGPDFGGKVKVDWSIISFTVHFGADQASASAEPITWDTFRQSFLPQDVCSIAAKEGLLRSTTGGAGEEIWVVNGNDCTLVTNSVVPSGQAFAGAMDNEGRIGQDRDLLADLGADDAPNLDIGIGSMEVGRGGWTSTHYVNITRTTDGEDVRESFVIVPVKKDAPAGLWGQSLMPEVNDQSLIPDTLAGFEIRSKDARTPDLTTAIDKSLLQFSETPISDAFVWEGALTFEWFEGTVDAINDSIATNSHRDGLLDALGMASSPVEVSGTVANAFLRTPQMERKT